MPEDAATERLNGFRGYLKLLAQAQLEHAGRKPIDASDVVQQTLVKAQEKLEQYRGSSDAELAGWLRAILANHLRDLLRRLGRELDEQALAKRLEQSSIRLDSLLAADDSSPSRCVARGEQLRHLADALLLLPDDQRIAIELRHLKQLKIDEIADRMQRSVPSIGGLLQRGLRTLRELMRTSSS